MVYREFFYICSFPFFSCFSYFLLRESRFWRFKASIGYFRPRSPLRYHFFFKISILDPTHPQNHDFLVNKKTEMSRPGEVGWAKKQKCRAPAKLGGAAPPPNPPCDSGGKGFALPPRPPILRFMRGFAPQTPEGFLKARGFRIKSNKNHCK